MSWIYELAGKWVCISNMIYESIAGRPPFMHDL